MTFTPDIPFAYLLNVEPSNLASEFDNITVPFTDQNGRSLEIEDKVNSALLINK